MKDGSCKTKFQRKRKKGLKRKQRKVINEGKEKDEKGKLREVRV